MEITRNNKSNQKIHRLKLKEGEINLASPVVMGILNITNDSFYDGGKFTTDKEILKQFEKMVTEGAAIIDIGTMSTRPGSEAISETEEKQRLLNALKLIKPHFPNTFISVDTYRSSIAEAAINEGAHIINDISAGTFDQNMFQTIGKLNVPYILMHIKGTPKNMQVDPVYENVVAEIMNFFKNRLTQLAKIGITKNIILDPGFGFGKTVEHNYQLLRQLDSFHEFGCPILAGISRKSLINKVLHSNPENALNGTTALNTIALLNGANILRVHDVKEAVEAVKLVEFYRHVEDN